ncbi:MAG: hypothetical protein U0Y10_15670 [Spirosomataceae bacterium]
MGSRQVKNMKIIGEIPNPSCKITLYSWNSKYIIKIEKGLLEQVYKVSEFDVAGEDELKDMLSESFIDKVMARFEEMGRDFEMALESVED